MSKLLEQRRQFLKNVFNRQVTPFEEDVLLLFKNTSYMFEIRMELEFEKYKFALLLAAC